MLQLVASTFPAPVHFDPAGTDRTLRRLLDRADLDDWTANAQRARSMFEATVDAALRAAFDPDGPGDAVAHLLMQRVLYRINRLQLFWYDALDAYRHERSPWLLGLRDQVEDAWQRWEARQIDVPALRTLDVPTALRERAARDVAPPVSESGRWFRDEAGLAGYRRLLEIASLDALVEASQLSRTLGGVATPVHATMTRLLLEEYGGGRPARKHSAYFATMMTTLGLDATPEAHLEQVPWPVLAGINQSFLLSDRKRWFLRYVGGLLYTEVSVPAGFACYRDAAIRLGLPPEARAYWDLHIKEDARHGPWMLNDVALPLAERYPADAWELVYGYDQQRHLSARAAEAVARAARDADAV
jgi:hypothetical protein